VTAGPVTDGSDGAHAGGPTGAPPDRAGAADLAASVLAEEARRQEASAPRPETVLPDDLLPGVGGAPMSLADALRAGGVGTIGVVGAARLIDGFDNAALSVLAPDIQDSLGASDAVMGAIGTAFGVLFLLGSIPMSSLADRYPRKWLAAAAMSLWSVVVLATALVQNAFWLFVARLGTGVSQSYALPVNAPLIMDAYPIPARGRVFATYNAFDIAGRALGPLFAGAVAGVVAGPESWRWAFVAAALLGVPVVLGLAAIREPRRGRNEMRAVLGEELGADERELPVSIGVAFERLRSIHSFRWFLTGMAALGFALFSVPLFLNLFLEDEFGLSAWERGLFGAVTMTPGILGLAIAAPRTDRLFRASPPAAVVFMGSMVVGFGALIVVGLFMPNVWLLGVFFALGMALSQSALATTVAITGSVIPYRLRSRGTAMVGVYIFLFGGFFGAVLTGMLTDPFGRRGALAAVVLPATVVGGALISYGARFIRGDISRCVEELLEEKAERDRVAEVRARAGGAEGAEVPAVQVRNLDFSYGSVQVLFDVNLDVAKGETLALLGTNGAGKSTLLRVISGLGVASRGVVRLNGRTITYTDPELRSRLGIVQLMGGKAVFPSLSVADNLRMAAFRYDGDELARRVDATLSRFPALAERRGTTAADLSGGQQQMLALAMALVHEPEVLIIDELSLGLAPIMVQELLATVRELKDQGLTMIIVEQSLNVALALADRAVFMEKGQVRFDGPARELAERDDLARAVFLGGDA
jgi:ABC-type branched-subunit amino acid transport system ATPase component/predicted MFS family arabinose efflux permease